MNGQRIGYVWVSSFDQNSERQLKHVEVGKLFTDKASGTAGFTDPMFGLLHLLAFRFAPRIGDLADKCLYIHGDAKIYPTRASPIGGKVNVKHIRAHWDEILRLAARSSRAPSPPH